MKRVIVSCMDYRLTDEILKRTDKDTLIFRNAGANVKEFLQRLKEINPDEVIYLPHTDCAAMKLVFNVVKKGENVSKNVKEKLVDVFSGQKFETLEELEQLNAKINEEMLKKEVTKNVKTELIDVKKIQWPQKKTEVYFYPITARPTDKIGAYILQSTSIDDVKADIEIAKDKLGFKDIYNCSSGDCKEI
ncbi:MULTISPECIES: carbonic anhydrase [unclassified Stygiolobus]|uniref:carbonic anhydrase n=1 Tax=unclassified Stygiolobus TaxID=2824672 RepID=UPI00307F652C